MANETKSYVNRSLGNEACSHLSNAAYNAACLHYSLHAMTSDIRKAALSEDKLAEMERQLDSLKKNMKEFAAAFRADK